MPKSSRTTIKKRAWKWFSKYIRLRDCLKTTGFTDQGKCVTCSHFFPFEELQAGHAIGGRNDSILFDEELTNAQCSKCNRKVTMGGLDGNYAVYHVWFIEKYGMEKFKKKIFASNQSKKLSTPELEEISDKYRKKYNKLLKRK